MKRIKFLAFGLVLVLAAGCNDAIDITQPGELSPDATFETVGDLEKGLNAVYAVDSQASEIAFSSIFTDEVRIGVGNGGQGLISGEYGFVLTTGSGDALSIWGTNLRLANWTSRLIVAGEALQIDESDADLVARKKNVIAQAHILRAWAQFKLVCYFSTNIADDNALGGILLDHAASTTEFIPRSTNGEIFAFINSDLAYVSDLAPVGTLDENGDPAYAANAENADKKFISADFVKAFKARMAAYREDYATAEALADELIASYPLVPQTNAGRTAYKNIWKDTNDSEVIFKFDRVNGDATIGSVWASVNATATGSPFYEMSTTLYNLLTANNGDVRKDAFLSPDFTDDVHPIGKYAGSSGINLLNDLKVFRTAEMVFIKAEARANAGDLAGVKTALQMINKARFSVANEPQIPVPTSTQVAWAEILKQRQIELCFEGHRYLDLKRIGPKANVDIVRDPADCAINGACTLSSSDYRFTMPIPITEIGANPAIRDQQNPGYNAN